MKKYQRRYVSPEASGLRLERRAEGVAVLEAHAAIYYREGDPATEYWLWDDLVERIMPGAFDAAIAERDDVRALWNHESGQLLGRIGSGTLRLRTDDRGLVYEVDLPDTTDGRNLAALVERGDVPGSSFGFMAGPMAKRGKVVWTSETVDGRSYDVREIHSLELFDISPCTFPAYAGTGEPMLRGGAAVEDVLRERDCVRESFDDDEIELDASAARMWLEANGFSMETSDA